MILYKHLPPKYCDALTKMGMLRIGTLNDFRKIEDSSRKDPNEGAQVSMYPVRDKQVFTKENIKCAPLEIQKMFKFNEKSGPVILENISIGRKYFTRDCFLMCLSTTKDKIFNAPTEAVEITDVQNFIITIQNNIVKNFKINTYVLHSKISYQDRFVNFRERQNAMFIKDKKFSPEKEYRFAFIPTDNVIKMINPFNFIDYRLTEFCRV